MRQVAAIRDVATFQPEGILDNDALSQRFPEWTAQDILKKTGIAVRRIAAEGETSGDLALIAARLLFAKHSCSPSDIDCLLLCTETPDYLLPPTSSILHHKLGLRRDASVLDFNHGCTGYIYGLSLAKGLIESGQARNVLLLTAETYSKLLGEADKTTRAIFSDGAAATLVSGVEPTGGSEGTRLFGFAFGTDGSRFDRLVALGTGSRREPGQAPSPLFMNGPDIFDFTLKCVPDVVARVLDNAGLIQEDIDLFLLHQANAFMLRHLQKKLRIPDEKFSICLENTGNTVSSSIPLAWAMEQAAGRIRPGARVMLVGFGVGLTWGGCIALV